MVFKRQKIAGHSTKKAFSTSAGFRTLAMALLFLYRDNNHHGEYNQNWSHDGLHHDAKHLLLGDSPSHSKLSFHLFDFTFGQKSSTALETQLADSLAVVAEEQHRDWGSFAFSSLMEICRSRCGTPHARSRCPQDTLGG